MFDFLARLDRRWIFLLMFLAVSIPILVGQRFPEEPSPMVEDVFRTIDELPDGSLVVMAFDYDPGSQGELHPMAMAFTRQCAKKRHKMMFMTLWPLGPPMIQYSLGILEREFPDLEYGTDYVDLGYRPGYEGPIKLIVTDLRKAFASDVQGTPLEQVPLTADLENIQEADLIVNVSAGYPGTKEWVLYAATPYEITTVAGCTGVQAPYLYPYIPKQLRGVLGAIKAAAEYESVLIREYPDFADNPQTQEALRRMGPQLVAHLMLIALIVLGNVIYFVTRRREGLQ